MIAKPEVITLRFFTKHMHVMLYTHKQRDRERERQRKIERDRDRQIERERERERERGGGETVRKKVGARRHRPVPHLNCTYIFFYNTNLYVVDLRIQA